MYTCDLKKESLPPEHFRWVQEAVRRLHGTRANRDSPLQLPVVGKANREVERKESHTQRGIFPARSLKTWNTTALEMARW